MTWRSCACAAGPNKNTKPTKGSTSLNFMNPPSRLIFAARAGINRKRLRILAACLMQGTAPQFTPACLVPLACYRFVKQQQALDLGIPAPANCDGGLDSIFASKHSRASQPHIGSAACDLEIGRASCRE